MNLERDGCPAPWKLEDDDGRVLAVAHGTFWAPNCDDGLELGGKPAVPRRCNLYSSSLHRPLVMDDKWT